MYLTFNTTVSNVNCLDICKESGKDCVSVSLFDKYYVNKNKNIYDKTLKVMTLDYIGSLQIKEKDENLHQSSRGVN